MHRVWFTPETAQRILVLVRPAVDDLLRIYHEMERRRPDRVRPDGRVDPTYFRLLVDLCRTLERIGRAGVQVKDPREGLLDFPARRDGREVLLCWKVGEATLDHWHEIDQGYAGRRRVDEEGPWEGREFPGERPG